MNEGSYTSSPVKSWYPASHKTYVSSNRNTSGSDIHPILLNHRPIISWARKRLSFGASDKAKWISRLRWLSLTPNHWVPWYPFATGRYLLSDTFLTIDKHHQHGYFHAACTLKKRCYRQCLLRHQFYYTTFCICIEEFLQR